jgi:hypothetical protein
MTPRIIFVPLTIVLTLALGGAASAKAVESITACGTGGCKEITPKNRSWEAFEFGNGVTDAPARASFYRITFHIGDGSGEARDRWSILFAPYQRKVRVQGDEPGTHRWLALFDGRSERLRRMIGHLRPYPADRLPATRSDDLPSARVVEVFNPASGSARADSGGGFPALPIAAVLLPAGLCGVALIRLRRARGGRVRAGAHG